MPFSYGLAMYGASGAGDEDLPKLVEKVTFSGATTATSSTLSLSGNHKLTIDVSKITTSSDGDQIRFQVSTDDGSTWNSGSDYGYLVGIRDSGAGSSNQETTGNTAGPALCMSGFGLGNASNETGSFTIHVDDPAGSTHKSFWWDGRVNTTDGDDVRVWGAGERRTTSAIDKVRLTATGNIAGDMYIYRWPDS